MRIGLVGLGKMGSGIKDRLAAADIGVCGYDLDPARRDVDSLAALVAELPAPRIIWVMLPAGAPTKDAISQLAELAGSGDIVIDGGNSRYLDDGDHARLLGERGIDYVDVGVSGGVWGTEFGFGMMAGGDAGAIERLMPVFDALRPPGPRADGFVHAGPAGAGHYAKMIHNGVEYGLMQSYAEGYALLQAADQVADADAVMRAWRRGTVVRSWLLDLLTDALTADPDLSADTATVSDSGEGRWTVEEAINHGVPVPAISAALFARWDSQSRSTETMRALAAMRREFGGHLR